MTYPSWTVQFGFWAMTNSAKKYGRQFPDSMGNTICGYLVGAASIYSQGVTQCCVPPLALVIAVRPYAGSHGMYQGRSGRQSPRITRFNLRLSPLPLLQ
jgi:hypothetical protein